MENLKLQLVDYLEKAYSLTQVALKCVQAKEFDKLSTTLDNRERIVNIIESLSENLALHSSGTNQDPEKNKATIQFNNQLNLVIEKISSMDEIITSCLEHEKNLTQFEIAKTFKNKENLKGYNLNKLK